MTNRLAASTSPYLLQHKDNPVDWWEWSPEAFAEARRSGRPILLSIGYAACHWCHVMAHESFEDEGVAAYMNDHFVNIKVDREERPDVDAIYMEATTALTGHGGWPMTCALTPDAEPFFCGTYFPPVDHPGTPSFPRVLTSIAEAWRDRRDEIEQSAAKIARQLAEHSITTGDGTAQPPSAASLDRAAALTLRDEDHDRGGFGSAPKFPPSMTLEALLRHHARTGDPNSLAAVKHTCESMARGGIYDQLAGGFARYSTDSTWTVPHFEKMLYDNGLLARIYLHLWRATANELAKRIAVETCEWMLAELSTENGGLASSLDADSDGAEGTFYVWSPAEVGPTAAELFGVTDIGTFEHGRSVLQLPEDPAHEAGWRSERARLLDLRARRTRPGRDDKVVTAWNGLAIAALAECGALLDRPDLIEAAKKIADCILSINLIDGRLRRASRDGRAGAPAGVLEDYGCLADGLLSLHQVTGEARWLDAAIQILEVAVAHFRSADGGFFDTADDAEPLLRRPKDPTDGATPSGLSSTADALITAAALTGRVDLRLVAEQAIASVASLIERGPRFAGRSIAAAEAMLAGPLEIAIVGNDELAAIARMTTSPGAVVVTGGSSPLLADRPPGSAYVCRNFSCDAPIHEPAALKKRLGVRATG